MFLTFFWIFFKLKNLKNIKKETVRNNYFTLKVILTYIQNNAGLNNWEGGGVNLLG